MYKTIAVMLFALNSLAINNTLLGVAPNNTYLGFKTDYTTNVTDYFIISDTNDNKNLSYPFIYNEDLTEDSRIVPNIGLDSSIKDGVNVNNISSDMLLNIDLGNKSIYIPYAKKYFALNSTNELTYSDTLYSFEVMELRTTQVGGFEHANLAFGYINPLLGNEISIRSYKDPTKDKPFYSINNGGSGFSYSSYIPLYEANIFKNSFSSLSLVDEIISDNAASTLNTYTYYYEKYVGLNYYERQLFQTSLMTDYAAARTIYEGLVTTGPYKNSPVKTLSVKYVDDAISDLIPYEYYSIRDANSVLVVNSLQANDNGEIVLPDEFFGKSLEIRKAYENTATDASDPYAFNLLDKPAFTDSLTIDYINENIGGMSSASNYQIKVDNVVTPLVISTEGKTNIEEEWFGKTVSIRKLGNETTPNSIYKEIILPARSSETVEAPFVPINITDTEISLEEVVGFEFSIDEINWTTTPSFKDLTPETYYSVYFRKSATETSFRSETLGISGFETKKKNPNTVSNDAIIKSIAFSSIIINGEAGTEYSLDNMHFSSIGDASNEVQLSLDPTLDKTEVTLTLFSRLKADETYGPSISRTQSFNAPSYKMYLTASINELFIKYNKYDSTEMLSFKNSLIEEVDNISNVEELTIQMEMLEPRFAYRASQDKAIYEFYKNLSSSSSSRVANIYQTIKDHINNLSFDDARAMEIGYELYFTNYINGFNDSITLEVYRDQKLKIINDTFNSYLHSKTFTSEEKVELWTAYKASFNSILSATTIEEIDANFSKAAAAFSTKSEVGVVALKMDELSSVRDVSIIAFSSLVVIGSLLLISLAILKREKNER